MTRRAAVLLRVLLAMASLVLWLAAGSARADGRPAGLPAVISVGSSGLDAGSIQNAVEHELGVPIVIEPSAEERLEIAVTGRRANVTYYARGREPVTRSVDLPKAPERALETIAFLAGNLARDEASELLRELAPAVAAAGAEAPAPPAPPPPPPPPPETKPAPAAATKAAAPAPPKAAPEKLLQSDRFAASVSLYYPLTARKHTERWRLNLELGLSYSRVGAIHGAGAALGYLRVDQSVEGVAGALFWTRTGDVSGIAGSLLVAEGYGSLKGIGFATIVNLRSGNVEGLQASAMVATADDVLGIEGAPLVTLGRDVRGLQASAGVTVGRDIQGARIGVVDVGRDVVGVQAGLINVGRDAVGAQVGFVNVGRRVKGLQLGLVNVADEIHGGAIGLVNVAGNGRLQPVVWLVGSNAVFMAGYKSITDFTYTQAGIGYEPSGDNYRWDVSSGLHLALGRGFYGEAGLGYDQQRGVKSSDEVRQEVRFDLRAGFEPVHGVTPFVGGSLTRRVAGGGADFRGEYALGVSFL